MDEVAVVQGLQAEVGELLVTLVVDGLAQFFQVEGLQLRVEQFELDAFFHVGRQGLGVEVGHLVVSGALGNAEEAQRFGTQGVHQQAGSDVGVVRLALYQGAGGHHQGGVDVLLGDAVVEVLQGFTLDQRAVDFGQGFAGFADDGVQAAHVQWLLAAIGAGDADARVRLGDFVAGAALGALQGAGFAVDHVVAGDFLLAGAHQGQLNLVLDLFDVDGAAGGHAALESRGDLLGQAGDGFMDTRRGRGSTALHCEERLGDGNGDLVVGVRNDSTVAFDHAQLAGRGGGQILSGICCLRRCGLRVLASGVGLHGVLHVLIYLRAPEPPSYPFHNARRTAAVPGANTWCFGAEGQDSSAFLALQVNRHGVEEP
ncbi:hypothetical protein D9M71_62970 [compost metagenome]